MFYIYSFVCLFDVKGVKIIEKHFTNNRKEKGPDSEFSMEPNDLKILRQNVDQAYKALGNINFKLKKSEKNNIKFRRSIYVINDIKKNQKFTTKNLKRIRPGYGLDPKYFTSLIGTYSRNNLKKGTSLKLQNTILNKLYKKK